MNDGDLSQPVRVVVIGGGPAGLLLSQLLERDGIETLLLERHDREHVLARIRAGVLESGTVQLLHQAGVGERMQREGFEHEGVYLSTSQSGFRIDFRALAGGAVTIYGQTELTRDLYEARDAMDARILHRVEAVKIDDASTSKPRVRFVHEGREHAVGCDFIAGCDGFHGVSRKTIPAHVLREFERVYPFGWLGLLSQTPPVSDELIYAAHERGFALCSMRNPNLSRYYLQVSLEDSSDRWSDEAF